MWPAPTCLISVFHIPYTYMRPCDMHEHFINVMCKLHMSPSCGAGLLATGRQCKFLSRQLHNLAPYPMFMSHQGGMLDIKMLPRSANMDKGPPPGPPPEQDIPLQVCVCAIVALLWRSGPIVHRHSCSKTQQQASLRTIALNPGLRWFWW